MLMIALLWGGEALRWRGDYDQAFQEARRSGKDVLLILVKRACPRGRALIRKIGEDRSLSSRLMQAFVPVIVTAGARAAYPIELYYTTRFPALFLVDAATELPRYGGCRGSGCLAFLREHLEIRENDQADLPHRSGGE